MSGKRICLGCLVVTVLGLGTARGQGPAETSGQITGSPGYVPAGEIPAPPPNAAPTPGPGMSTWLIHPRSPGCCCPLGDCGPIGYEVYGRIGPSFPIGGGIFGNQLATGWAVEGGGRTLFFNAAQTTAFTIDLGIVNIYNSANGSTQPITLLNVPQRISGTGNTNILPSKDVVLASLNQTYGSLSFGQEFYLWGNASCFMCAPSWRVGYDAGPRYGTASAFVHDFRHQTDVIAGPFVAVHTDYVYPCNCCTFFAGLRLGYGYTWSDIFQRQNRSDIQYLNLLFNLGIRF